MRSKLSVATLIAVVVLIPVVPFVLIGWWLEPWISRQLGESTSTWTGMFAGTVLATDIFLPVPSSAVCAWAGKQLGMLAGTIWCWLGLTIGSVAGFALARIGGRPLVDRVADQEALEQLERVSDWGGWLVVLTRPIPIFAEAAVLFLGINQFPWLPFLLVILISNLAVAWLFVATGAVAAGNGWYLVGMIAVVAFPVAAALAVRRWLRTSSCKLGS